jgi:hypothetical protein
MKTKFYWLALLASAAMIAQANAGGHHSGGGDTAGNVIAPAPASPRSGAVSHVAPVAARGSNGGRTIYYSGRRFSPVGQQRSGTFHPNYINPDRRTNRFEPATMNRVHDPRFANREARTGRSSQLNSRSQLRTEHLRPDWRSHVFAQRSTNWQRNWDRQRDHWWHGHRCHFFNGSWIVFDLGFYPWDTFWYPYDNYYGYGYYPYSYNYDPGYYDSYDDQAEGYYGQNSDVDQYNNSTVGSAQERLAREGYYRGEIDGVVGPQTRRAIARYQRDQGLRVTGALTRDTVQALGLQRVALY